MKQKILKFLSRSWIYTTFSFLIMVGCEHFIPSPYDLFAGIALISGLVIAILFHLYEG